MSILQNENEWIPVTKQLPNPEKEKIGKQKREEVIVTLKNGVVKEMMFEFETGEFWEPCDPNHLEHRKENNNESDFEVIAWQPLPEPYILK